MYLYTHAAYIYIQYIVHVYVCIQCVYLNICGVARDHFSQSFAEVKIGSNHNETLSKAGQQNHSQ